MDWIIQYDPPDDPKVRYRLLITDKTTISITIKLQNPFSVGPCDPVTLKFRYIDLERIFGKLAKLIEYVILGEGH